MRLSPAFDPVSDGVRRSGVPMGLGGTVVVVVEVLVVDLTTVVLVVLFVREAVVKGPVPRWGAVVRGEVVAVVPRRGAVVVVADVGEPVAVLFATFPKGFDVSITSESDCGVRGEFPAVSAATAVTVHVPSASSGRVQPPTVGEAT